MFIFPVQDFCSLRVWMPECVCMLMCISRCACVCGQSRWNTRHHMALPVGGITWTGGVTAGDLRGWRGVEALRVPQANRPDKIRVEGAQLEAFLSWPLSPPLSHSSKPLAALFLPVLSVPPFYLLTSLSCLNSPPFSLSLHPLFFIFQTVSSCLEVSLDHFFLYFCVVSPLLFFTLLPLLHLPSPPPPLLSRTSVKWGQPLACNAMSFLCFSLALWPCSLILASLNWPIAFHVFPWVMS